MSSKPTPTAGGAWRVIDGRLVNEAEAPKPRQPATSTPPKPARQQRQNPQPTKE